ncbi:MAG: hypothetical protein KGZ66_06770 [Selenomonadales bacterium]|nr:hypothetical protein [Selenomonadales bacterium]
MEAKWKRDAIIRYSAVVCIAALVMSNVWLMIKVNDLIRAIGSLPRHIPSPTTYVNLSPLYTGVVDERVLMVSETMGEKLIVRYNFTLTERIPGYVLVVRFRASQTAAWEQVRPAPLYGLEYEAFLHVNPALSYEYQVVQMLGDQVMRATTPGFIKVGEWVGTSTLNIVRSGYPNERKVRVAVYQPQFSALRAWQVDKVTIKLDNAPEAVVLEMFRGDLTGYKFDETVYQAARAVTVTAYYGDGETRSVTFDPHNHFEQPIIRRD